MKTLSLLCAFAGGAIAGAVAGVLLAPDKGEKTRKRIVDMACDTTHDAKKKLIEFFESMGIEMDKNDLDDLVEELIDRTHLKLK